MQYHFEECKDGWLSFSSFRLYCLTFFMRILCLEKGNMDLFKGWYGACTLWYLQCFLDITWFFTPFFHLAHILVLSLTSQWHELTFCVLGYSPHIIYNVTVFSNGKMDYVYNFLTVRLSSLKFQTIWHLEDILSLQIFLTIDIHSVLNILLN